MNTSGFYFEVNFLRDQSIDYEDNTEDTKHKSIKIGSFHSKQYKTMLKNFVFVTDDFDDKKI